MRTRNGFTLVELITTMLIIVTLAAIIAIASFHGVAKSRVVRTQGDLATLKSALAALYMDTSRYILGCPPFQMLNSTAVVPLDDQWAGLLSKPSQGVPPYSLPVNAAGQPLCRWTAENVSAWQGPYVDTSTLSDVWKNKYVFDAMYEPCCPTFAENPPIKQLTAAHCKALNPDYVSVRECAAMCSRDKGATFECPGPLGQCPPPVVRSKGPDELDNTCDDIILTLKLKK